MKKVFLLIPFILMGCKGALTDEEILAAGQKNCSEMGFKSDSEAYSNCLLQLRVATLNEAQQKKGNGIAAGAAAQANYWNIYNAATRYNTYR